jgi:uncharacterized protein with HEPN domain
MKKDPRLYLLHIRDAITDIEKYVPKGKAHFLRTQLIQDAVIYKLAIIGEAVRKLPESLRNEYPSIPWKSIVGLRNIVIHEYDGTDVVTIWNIVSDHLPVLKKAVKELLKKLPETPAVKDVSRKKGQAK